MNPHQFTSLLQFSLFQFLSLSSHPLSFSHSLSKNPSCRSPQAPSRQPHQHQLLSSVLAHAANNDAHLGGSAANPSHRLAQPLVCAALPTIQTPVRPPPATNPPLATYSFHLQPRPDILLHRATVQIHFLWNFGLLVSLLAHCSFFFFIEFFSLLLLFDSFIFVLAKLLYQLLCYSEFYFYSCYNYQ